MVVKPVHGGENSESLISLLTWKSKNDVYTPNSIDFIAKVKKYDSNTSNVFLFRNKNKHLESLIKLSEEAVRWKNIQTYTILN